MFDSKVGITVFGLLAAILTGPSFGQCSAGSGTITVTLQQADQALYEYRWTVTNTENGNGNRVEDVFFEISTADSASTGSLIAQWARTIGMVDATWNGLQFNHTGGPSICRGGGSCSSDMETFDYALDQFVSSLRVRTVQANGQTEDFVIDGNTSPACSALLPVELVSFDARANGEEVVLNWTTASEDNVAGYEIEHRRSEQFESLGFVAAGGNSDVRNDYAFAYTFDGPVFGAFRLKMIDFDGAFEYSPIVEVGPSLPWGFHMSPNYPNPFNPSTRFDIVVARAQQVQLDVFDVTGRKVANILSGRLEAGEMASVEFRAGDLPSGLYVARAVGETFTSSRIMTLLK